MEKIKNDLMDFVKYISDKSNKSVLEIITQLRLNFIFDDVLPLKERISILAQRSYQKRMNELYLGELEKIYSLCNDDIKVIVFKGIAHAFSFYSIPCFRLFNDIDLFVRVQDCEKVIRILEKLGYVESGIDIECNRDLFYVGDLYANIAIKTHDYIDNQTRNHRVFKKLINGICIEIEIHSFLFPLIRYPFINYDDIYFRIRKIHTLENKLIYALSVEDTLICAACHLCKHIVDAIMRPDDLKTQTSHLNKCLCTLKIQ